MVSSKDQVAQGDALTITVSDGVIPATVGKGKERASRVKKRRAVPQEAGMERLL